MKKAAVYVRVSRREQVTIPDQIKRCRATAEAHDWAVADEHVFQDRGISGWSGKDRPKWTALEQAVERREVDAVIVFAISRAARDVPVLHGFVQKCRERNIPFVSASEPFDTSTEMGRAMVTILGALAEMESAVKSERVGLGMQREKEAGRWVYGDAPFGYDLDPAAEGRLRINEREAKAIEDGVKIMLNGGSAARVAREWNAAGITTKAGKQWTNNDAKRVLVSERIAGTLDGRRAKWDEIITLRNHQQIVDLFAKNPKVGGSRSDRYLLTGLLYCGICGDRKLIGRPNSGTRRYVCSGGPPGHRMHIGINAEALERHVREEADLRVVPDPVAPEDPEVDRELYAKRDEIDAEIEEWGTRVARREVNERYARGALRELERQVEEVERKLAERPRGRFGKLLQYAEDFLEVYPDDRAQLDAQVERIVVNPSPAGFKTKAVESRVEVQWRPEAELLA